MNLIKKSNLATALSLVFLGSTVLAGNALAGHQPKIKEIKSSRVGTMSVVLPLKYEKFEDKRVRIKVRIKNHNTGKSETRTFTKNLGEDNGRKKLTVDGLDPGTRYSFQVKMKRATGNPKDYTKYSDSRSITTKSR